MRNPFTSPSALKQGMAGLCLLVLAACGGRETMNAEGPGENVTAIEKASLERMENGVFEDFLSAGGCVSSSSPHAGKVAAVVSTVNSVLPGLPEFHPPVRRVELRDAPPRGEDEIAVYLCDGMNGGARTLYRSVFLSNSLLDDLRAKAGERDGENLFESSVAFVLFHEIGHAALNHSAMKLRAGGAGVFDYAFDMPREMEADGFARAAMARAGLSLDGMALANPPDKP